MAVISSRRIIALMITVVMLGSLVVVLQVLAESYIFALINVLVLLVVVHSTWKLRKSAKVSP